MTTYLVSRHPAAIEWMRRELPAEDVVVLPHLAEQSFLPGDRVAGVLPLRWAEAAWRAGAQVWSLDLDPSPHQRGRELGIDELAAAGARLTAYRVERA
jgi:CRISPR-associated protein Csx16